MTAHPPQPAPGWWLASDGNWYPPESAPAPAPPPPGPVPSSGPQGTGPNGTATAALVTGILAVLLCWTFLGGLLLGGTGIVLGVIGLKKARGLVGETGSGLATAGIVLGGTGCALSLVIGSIVMIAFLGAEAETEFREVGEQIEGINTDPVDGFCDVERYMQDPDCP